MSYSNTIAIPPRTATMVTVDNVTAVRLQLQDGDVVRIKGTVGATAPADWSGDIVLERSQILPLSVPLSDLFVGGVNRLWCWSEESCLVSVAHA